MRKPESIHVRLMSGACLAMPGLAAAHGTDHLHFWGLHDADGQGMLLGGLLLALAVVGWVRWQRRR